MQAIYLTGLEDKAAFHLTTAPAPQKSSLVPQPKANSRSNHQQLHPGEGEGRTAQIEMIPASGPVGWCDLSHPLPAAQGLWGSSMWPMWLSVAKVPYSIVSVLKLDPIKTRKRRKKGTFLLQHKHFKILTDVD